MNRTLKEATVRRYHYETHRQLREHLEAFLNAYDFAKRLKTLRGLTPYAGARALLVSHWSVDDESTVRITTGVSAG
jgi:hypothetical protein